jgi:hypothetical protein
MSNELDILGMEEIEMENTSIDDIDNESINLIFVAIDGSGSMGYYTDDMKNCLNDFKDAINNSKEVDEILVARADFDGSINVGGYKKIDEFDTGYRASGMTSLYDVIYQGSEKLLNYMDYLKQQGMRVKAVFSVFSDGEDTSSRRQLSDAKDKIRELNSKEITTAFISFGNDALSEAKRLEFKNILTVGNSASELRKAFNCLSKSVIESSKSVINKTDDFFDM